MNRYKGVEARSVALANSHLLTFDTRGEWTSDKRVRQALALSVDRQKLVDSLWLGKAGIPGAHNYPEFGRMYQVIVEMWKAVGVNAQLQVVENFSQMRAKGQQVGNNSNSTRLPDPFGALWISYGPASYFQQSGEFTEVEPFNTFGRALEKETD